MENIKVRTIRPPLVFVLALLTACLMAPARAADKTDIAVSD
jgi:hypothetical protein